MLRALTRDDLGAQRTLDVLARQISTKLAELDSTVTLRRTSEFSAAVALVQTNLGKDEMDRIRVTLGTLEANERRLLATRAAAEEHFASAVTVILIGGTLVTFVIVMLLNGILTRYAESQATAARELNRQNKQLDEQNGVLESQSLELELQNQRPVTPEQLGDLSRIKRSGRQQGVGHGQR